MATALFMVKATIPTEKEAAVRFVNTQDWP
jgi:hypothetical protein